jgi:hypothetical protein
MDTANTVLPLYVTMLLFFAGFLITFDKIPPWWGWFSYINFLRCVGGVWTGGCVGGDREQSTAPGEDRWQYGASVMKQGLV